jgi:L-lactate dehydrogenase complex protein LldG
MAARDDVLARVRQALVDVPPDEPSFMPRTPVPGDRVDDLVGLFTERVADYRASVWRCSPENAPAAIGEMIPAGAHLVVPDGFPADLLPDGIEVVVDDQAAPLTPGALDQLDAVITTCAVGIATTGTVVLDHGPGQGRRVLTLVPDVHVCVIRTDQIVADVPDAIARLDPSRAQTWISGPSATSDIELSRVEGVHGPRHLHVIVIGQDYPTDRDG